MEKQTDSSPGEPNPRASNDGGASSSRPSQIDILRSLEGSKYPIDTIKVSLSKSYGFLSDSRIGSRRSKTGCRYRKTWPAKLLSNSFARLQHLDFIEEGRNLVDLCSSPTASPS
jgi:hypothetical protein